MNSRQQFLKTVNHQQPDRVVIDLGGTSVTGIHIQTISKLRRHFGLQRKPIRVIEPFQMLGEVGWELIGPGAETICSGLATIPHTKSGKLPGDNG
jgi:hypothetical protein